MTKVILSAFIALSIAACGGTTPSTTSGNSGVVSHNQELILGKGPKDAMNLAVVFTFDKKNDDEVDKTAKKVLSKIGFHQNDPHHNVNKVYEKNFGYTALETLTFSTMFNDPIVRPLLNKDPRLAGFSPFNLLHYRLKNDGVTVLSHITPEAMMNILEIKDPEIKTAIETSMNKMDQAISKELGGKKSYVKMQGRAKKTMMNFEIPFNKPSDIDDFLDEFQEKFDLAFVQKGFILAGFYNAKDSYHSEEDVLTKFDSFWVYSLCHIPFSYEVFDGKDPLPIAGIFGPCSMYVYVKKGENKFVIGMPTLSAWAGALNITAPDKLKKINQLDSEITEVIHSLGGRNTDNHNPLSK